MTGVATAPETRLWLKCGGCNRLLYVPKHERNLQVCADCGYHERLSAPERIEHLTDPGSFTPLPLAVEPVDVLGFVDTKPYTDRLSHARATTGLDESVVVGSARIGGVRVVLAVMDFRFLGGSLGAATGELIARAVDTACETGCPFVVVTASGGARMQEGTLSLMQMATVSQALGRLRDAGQLSISVITDPTYGGVAASFATNVDIVVAERGSRMGFAGRRVIAQTVKVELPPDFQTADFLLEHGQVDMVADRRDIPVALGRLLGMTRSLYGRPPVDAVPAEDAGTGPQSGSRMATARDVARPTCLDYIGMLVDDFVELHGDRMSGDDPALVGGLGRFRGRPALILGHQRGHTTAELVARGFGMPSPAGYRKATRLIRLAGRLGLPVISLVDTPGANPGPQSEENGQSAAIATCIQDLAACPTPVVAVVTGEGGSGGALALAVADRVLMLENAIYSVISPEGCAAILWGTNENADRAAHALQISAPEQLRLGVVDEVVPEPPGGAQADPHAAATSLGEAVVRAVDHLCPVPAETLLKNRSTRLRRLAAGRIMEVR